MHWLDKVIALIGDQPEQPQDKQLELKQMIREAKDKELISATGLGMIQGILRLEKKSVAEVMIPSADVDTVNYKDSLIQVIDKVVSTGHSRFPVIKSAGQTDSIMGVLMIKDLFPLINKPEERGPFHIKNFLRKPLLVPEGKKLSELLFDFQQENTHIAVVSDQFGLISGIVTIDNITSEIIGQIDDEHQKKKRPKIKKQKDGKFLVRANISLNKFNAFFKTNLSSDGVETLAGFALYKIGQIPEQDYEFSAAGLKFKIVRATNRRIVSIEVSTDANPDNYEDSYSD